MEKNAKKCYNLKNLIKPKMGILGWFGGGKEEQKEAESESLAEVTLRSFNKFKKKRGPEYAFNLIRMGKLNEIGEDVYEFNGVVFTVERNERGEVISADAVLAENYVSKTGEKYSDILKQGYPDTIVGDSETGEKIIGIQEKFRAQLQSMGLPPGDITKVQDYLEKEFEGTREEILGKFMKSLEDFRQRIKKEGFKEVEKGTPLDIERNDVVMITRGGSIVIMKRLVLNEHEVRYIPIAPREQRVKIPGELQGKGKVKNNPIVGKSTELGIDNIPKYTSPVIFAAVGSLQESGAMKTMQQSINKSFAGLRSLPKTRRYEKGE
jgi:hypothetical protein